MNTSMKIVLLVTLVTNIDFSFGVASLWTMVKSVHGEKSDAAAAHTLFAFSRLISTPIFGFLADGAPLRVTLLLGLAAYILSSIQYIATTDVRGLLFARVLGGVGIAVLTPVMTHITRSTSPEERTSAMSNFYLAQSVGSIVTPALSAFLPGLRVDVFGVRVEGHTAPGFITLVAATAASVAVLLFYGEPEGGAKPKVPKPTTTTTTTTTTTVPRFALAGGLYLWFAVVIVVAIFQNTFTIVSEEKLSWSAWQTGSALTLMGFLNTVVLFAVKGGSASGRWTNRAIVYFSLACAVAHTLVLGELLPWRFGVFDMVVCIALWAVVNGGTAATIATLYSEMAKGSGGHEALLLSLLPVAASLGRLVAPRFTVLAPQRLVLASVATAGTLIFVTRILDKFLFKAERDRLASNKKK